MTGHGLTVVSFLLAVAYGSGFLVHLGALIIDCVDREKGLVHSAVGVPLVSFSLALFWPVMFYYVYKDAVSRAAD